MQCHVAALDAFGRQRTQGGQVLRQSYRDSGFAQFLRRCHAHDLERQPRQGVGLGGAAH